MAMAFKFSYEETILFGFWKTSTPLSFLLSCGIVFLLGVFWEYLGETRRQLDRDLSRSAKGAKEPRSGTIVLQDDQQWKRSILYAASMLVSYLLMLIAMTYNVLLFAAVIGGVGVGHFLYARRLSPSDESEADGGCH
ncbi:Ctr copper transporter [Hyaloraphidium curvatum]|nr:Ctr copper transporter [Hyaloraphidium curvatum]